INELLKKLTYIEWEDFEVKEAKGEIPKSSWETVSSFSNTAGGWLIFGVKKTGLDFEIIGVGNPEKIEQDFLNTLRSGQKFSTKIEVSSKKYNVGEKAILAFFIPLSPNKPVYYDNPKNTFIRSGSGDQRATTEEVNALFRDSVFGLKDQETTNFKLKDLDKESISRFRTLLKNMNSESILNAYTDAVLFEKIRVTIKNKVTIGGLLLFGDEDRILEHFPDFMVDYLEIRGTSYSDAPERYTYRMPQQKNLLNYYFAILDKLLTKIDVPFKLNGTFRDENFPHKSALREGLVNLLVHSDYYSPMKPRIRVFTDRIEFMNPGSLPAPFDVLRKQGLTLPRNPIIIKAFRVIKLAENAGYGFDKMFDGWKTYYQNYPVVDNQILYYVITFPLETINERQDKGPDKRPDKINLTQKKIVDAIKNNPNITAIELSEIVGISDRQVKTNLKVLVQNAILERVGSRKTGYWNIKE
ncbi:TPA: hypothetical protein DCR49_07310, partial [Candidatus Delongbacteria bacterium]|nr:hypothetical protein [Candidatus Delongbacteria bacterium]